MIITQIKDAAINNIEFSREASHAHRSMRITFDIETPIGVFNYDSDWRRDDEIRQIIHRFDFYTYADIMDGSLPRVTLDISTDTGGGGH